MPGNGRTATVTGYFPLKAAFEHVGSPDPYLFDLGTSADFLDYGYEQQGAIMEEYVCCRTLAPQAARTERLHEMLSAVLSADAHRRPLTEWVALPWEGWRWRESATGLLPRGASRNYFPGDRQGGDHADRDFCSWPR